ncbi:hypothetical protein ACFL08_00435 [Patescibacteria group bacterium]
MNTYDIGEIYRFKKYYFTDENGEDCIKPRHAVVLISTANTGFVTSSAYGCTLEGQAFFMPILRHETCVREPIRQLLRKSTYGFLDQDRYCCPAIHDMQNISERGILRITNVHGSDVNPLFKKIKNAFFARRFPDYMLNPYIKGVILQEWSSLRGNII